MFLANEKQLKSQAIHLKSDFILRNRARLAGFSGVLDAEFVYLSESKNGSQFSVLKCDNELMKRYSFVRTIVSDPLYLEFVMKSSSSVQFVIFI